jgi:predicted alpha/beta superfamily hydrolase
MPLGYLLQKVHDWDMRNKRAAFFFTLSVIGFITAWYFNGIAVMKGQDYLSAWFASEVDWVLSLDLLIVAVAGVGFMIYEARRLGMRRVWLYILLSGITAMAATFPFFLAMRELRLRSIELAGGKIDKYEFDGHRVDVWVPPNPDESTPVLVMHDGKNVFYPKFSTYGATWGLLEAMRPDHIGYTRIQAERKPLIIAVWGLGDPSRIMELGPEDIYSAHPEIIANLPDFLQPADPTPRSNAYQALLATKILPSIAAKYGVKLDPSRTAISGSSMGGLASIYGMCKYPETYGTALSFSTHWPFGYETTIEKLTAMMPSPGMHRIWTDTGTLELDAEYPPFHAKAVSRLEELGYRFHHDLMHGVYANTGHNENWWASRVEHPINWWLSGLPSKP